MSRTQKAYVRPATLHASSSTDPSLPPLGIRVRLKARYDISRFSASNQVILTAMKQYGMFLADNGSNWLVSGEANSGWDDDDLSALKSVPASAFEVVKVGTIVLFDRSGAERARVSSSRQVTTAAFDGSLLVVADRAKFTTYDTSLVALASADLMESCTDSVLVSQSRFVCGPSNDWDRVYYTYDAKTGLLLASSDKYTYNGRPMRRVPGTDDFVTVTNDTSPPDFHLYTVLVNGQAKYINESPYHGDFSVTTTYAFDGTPPKHLITSGGLLLRIYDNNCSADADSFDSSCFVKDGVLGTLTGSQSFAGMDSDSSSLVYGLVNASGDYMSGACAKGCLLEKVDVPSRTVVSQAVVHLSMSYVVAFRHDPIGNVAVVGYVNARPNTYSYSDPYPGYQVSILRY